VGERQERETALGDLRVLDLTGEIGVYCTKMLADLGADVIRIEPPGGHPMRRIGPFVKNQPDEEKSLYHFFFNTSKRGVTLNLEDPEGQNILRQLVEKADVLVETFPPGYMQELGLGYEDLSEINPGLIMASITPWGQTGPYKHFKATNIVGDAMGGLMFVTGSPDDPPLMSAANQAYYLAGEQAAVGVMMALCYRDNTGEGQYIDISMQEAVALTIQPQSMFWPGKGEVAKRFGYGQRTSNALIYASSFYPCRDGWITGLYTQPRNWVDMVAWLTETGFVDDLADPKYNAEDERLKEAAHIQEVMTSFAAAHTMDELTEGGQRYHMFVFPTYTVADIVNDPHLKTRNFFQDVEHSELGMTITYPGAPYGLSGTPWRISRRAPLIGEHNMEVYHGELGIPGERLVTLKSVGTI